MAFKIAVLKARKASPEWGREPIVFFTATSFCVKKICCVFFFRNQLKTFQHLAYQEKERERLGVTVLSIEQEKHCSFFSHTVGFCCHSPK